MSDTNNPSNSNDASTDENALKEAIQQALAPASNLVFGYELMKEQLIDQIADVLANVQIERISVPPTYVVGPAMEAFRYAIDNHIQQDFLSRLIAKALDTKTNVFALPSYVNIIKHLVPDEGLILRLFVRAQQFPLIDVKLKLGENGGFNTLHRNVCMVGMMAQCHDQRLINEYLDNLCRAGLCEITDKAMSNPGVYEELENLPGIEQVKKQFEDNANFDVVIERKSVRLTALGSEFVKTCVLNKRHKRNIA